MNDLTRLSILLNMQQAILYSILPHRHSLLLLQRPHMLLQILHGLIQFQQIKKNHVVGFRELVQQVVV